MWRKKRSINQLKLDLKRKKVGKLLDQALKSDTEIHFAPISDEYFIIDKEKQISICISNFSVRITNHQYLYEVNFSENTMNKYMKKAKQKVQEKTDMIKKNLFRNEINLIDKIKNLYDE